MILGVSCGGVWVTEDRGVTWSCQAQGMRAEYMPPERQFDPYIQDPHRVVRCPTEPRSLWVSVDQGDSWQTVAEHLPPVYAVRWEAGKR
jgi:photosystem II stability/assembly factor-like uncharacterized protein